MKRNSKIILIFILFLFILLSLTTRSATIDTREYTDSAKFFTGEFSAKLRTSHPLTYGVIHSPFVKLFNGFFIMKITSIISLLLIIASVYYMSRKDKRTFLLLLVSPIIWFMGPAINPIQLSGLFFLWGFFFFSKFNKNNKISNLFYSGILIGLALCLWHTVLIILIFFIICFFYNKNVNHFFLFLFFILIGLFPLALIDLLWYGIPLFSLIKFIAMTFIFLVYGSIYQGVYTMASSFAAYLSFIIMLPFFGYTLFSKEFFIRNKRPIIFLTLSFLFFLIRPQVRYMIFLWPILMLYLPRALTRRQLKIQFVIFCVISLFIISSYAVQIQYPNNAKELVSMAGEFNNFDSNLANKERLIREDLDQLVEQYSNKVFLVGNEQDSYADLAYLYWGKEVEEFVSIEDYLLFINNDPVLFEKEFKSKSRVNDRRQIWISGGIRKNQADNTDYRNITLAIGIGEPIKIPGFAVIKKYNLLYLSELSESKLPDQDSEILEKHVYNFN